MTQSIYDLTATEPTATPAIAAGPMLFHSLTLERRPRGLAVVGSIAIHAMAVVLMLALSEYTLWIPEKDFNWAQYRIEPLRFHLSEPLYFKASAPATTASNSAPAVPSEADNAAGAGPPPATPAQATRRPV